MFWSAEAGRSYGQVERPGERREPLAGRGQRGQRGLKVLACFTGVGGSGDGGEHDGGPEHVAGPQCGDGEQVISGVVEPG